VTPRLLISSSVLLNAALLAWLLALVSRNVPSPLIQAQPDSAAQTMTEPQDTAEPQPGAIALRPDFHWSDLMSDDLEVYRDRLRDIGCPELTVRDILIAEIKHRVGERRRAFSRGIQSRFWDVAAQGGKDALDKEWGESLAEFRREIAETIKAVLGPLKEDPDVNNERTAEARRIDWEGAHSWLPDEKRAQLISLEERYWNLLQEARAISTDSQNPERIAREAVLKEELNRERQALLTAGENEEYALRSFGNANWAARVAGFEPTEDEWRQVTRLRLASSETHSAILRPPDGSRSNLSEADVRVLNARTDAELESAIATALGPERYAEYRRGLDSTYQQTLSVMKAYDLPTGTADHVYSIQQSATASAAQVRQDTGLTDESRAAALSAIQAETERTLNQLLGPAVMKTYQTHTGQWIGQIHPTIE
jgi:hypothetical protein